MAEIENPKIRQFYQDALTFIQATKKGTNPADPCFVIRPGMDEWTAWAAYLQDRCGLLPAVMKAVEKRRLDSFTVPAQWPQWFDAFYRAPEKPFYRSEVRPEITTEERERTIAAMEAYKRNPPPPILGDPSWALLEKKGNRKLLGWQQAGAALSPYTGRNQAKETA